jgi:phage terminase large subunit-like protein
MQNSSIAWLDFENVDRASGEHLNLSDFRKHYCVAGIDLSRTTDLTAASIVVEKSGEFYIFTQFFMPKDSFEKACENEPETKYEVHKAKGRIIISGEHFVDYKDVFNWFLKILKEYKIMPLQVGYDRYSAQYLIQDLNGSGFKTDDVFQGTNLSPILDEFEGLLKDGKIHIGDNELLKKQLLDVAVKINESDERKRPVKIESRLHIDGPVSIFDAFTVRSKWYKSIGKMLQNKKVA